MTAESQQPQEEEPTLAARVNERHEHGESIFIEPTPREVHDLLEEAAGEGGAPASA